MSGVLQERGWHNGYEVGMEMLVNEGMTGNCFLRLFGYNYIFPKI